MGHESLAGLSPAHRRNQNPVSPSATMFKRSANFLRDETDLTWRALIRRHRFLLLMLALLTFLCTLYLYFAIKLGSKECSGLTGKEETLCRLKFSKAKKTQGRGSRRGLFTTHDSTVMPLSEHHIAQQMKEIPDVGSWVEHITSNGKIHRVLNLGCTRGTLTEYMAKQTGVTMSVLGCEEEFSVDRSVSRSQLSFLLNGPPSAAALFDLIICEKCNMLELAHDGRQFWEFGQLLRDGGNFLWVSDSLGGVDDASLRLANLQMPGWICLSRVDDGMVWQTMASQWL